MRMCRVGLTSASPIAHFRLAHCSLRLLRLITIDVLVAIVGRCCCGQSLTLGAACVITVPVNDAYPLVVVVVRLW